MQIPCCYTHLALAYWHMSTTVTCTQLCAARSCVRQGPGRAVVPLHAVHGLDREVHSLDREVVRSTALCV
jgi:hypothetical protein